MQCEIVIENGIARCKVCGRPYATRNLDPARHHRACWGMPEQQAERRKRLQAARQNLTKEHGCGCKK